MQRLSDMVDTFVQAWKQVEAQKNQRRDLTEADRLSWYDAGTSRSRGPADRTVQDVQALIRNRNPVRWRQFKSHYRWVQKEMKKLGLNPEDARYLL